MLGPEAFDAAPFLDLLREYGEPVVIEDRSEPLGTANTP